MLPAALANLHEHTGLITRTETVAGRLLLWSIASLMLLWHEVTLLMPVALALVMIFPQQRRLLLSIVAVAVLAERFLGVPGMSWMYIAAGVLAGIVCLYVFFRWVQQFERWPGVARRHPLILLHIGIWIALILSTNPWFGILGLVPFMAWRLSYMVMQGSRGKLAGTKFTDHLFYMFPVYGGTATPYGKGMEYLSRHEALDATAFARSQLAGIKLLVLSAVWFFLLDLMNLVFFGASVPYLTLWPETWALDLPRVNRVLADGLDAGGIQGWALIYLELIRATLSLAAKGHIIVGCLRLLGFNVFRNTYKPLLAQSILEFWNRFYYYFKELMVEFFFYPTYLKLRNISPSARMFTAIFTAAFLGNMYHHILNQPDTVTAWDPGLFWSVWGPRFVYCFLLALGVGVSMVRQQKLRQSAVEASRLVKLRRIAGVWTFYGIIQIWNIKSTEVSIADCTRFFLSLFGL